EPMDMWLSGDEPQGPWIQYEFNKVHKLHQMWVWNSNQIFESLFGFGMKDVTIEYSTDGTAWTALADVPQFTKAPGAAGYAHDTTVDFSGAVAKYVKLTATSNWGGILPQYGLSEVRFFSIPVGAREPSPDTGAADVNPAVILSWRVGREAATHDVYISSDEQAIIDGTVPAVSVTEASYSTDLDLADTYFWRIDEVNDAETPATWQGDVWSFSTPEYLVVDDFESYNDIDPPDPESNRIFESWSDGFGVATNGALVGNDFPPYLETTIVHDGAQSMPVFYSNTGGAVSSEITRTFAPGQDWTKHGIQTLVLYFQGIPGNTGQLYIKVNGVKVSYPGDAANLARLIWTQWTIDLASLGVNLTSITSLAIGIDGNGAAGTLYVDDIVLYRFAPPAPTSQIYLEAEAGTITAPLKTYSDPLASGGSYIGTDDGTGDENSAPPATGVATYNFTAEGGVYTISLRVIITGGSNSFWVRIPGATNYAPGTHSTGWIRFNDISDGADWHWDDVHSNDHNNQVVSITVPAGPHTLEIARREDGTLLDAIVISKVD
ncbi:MAG: discoidin domain-containing protein, partial [Phycisphaerales bacterium]